MSVRLSGGRAVAAGTAGPPRARAPARYAARVLDEGLRIAAHPGITFRSSPTGGRLAALVDGPDIVEVVKVVRGLEPSGDDRIHEAAIWLDLPERKIRTALDYYADFPEEVDAELEIREQAEADFVQRLERRRDLLG